jgi:hypothetical protein
MEALPLSLNNCSLNVVSSSLPRLRRTRWRCAGPYAAEHPRPGCVLVVVLPPILTSSR